MKRIKITTIGIFLWLIAAGLNSHAQEISSPPASHQVVHTVIFKFSDQASPDQVSQLMVHIKDLRYKVEGIGTITFGENFSKRSKGFTKAVTITFNNKAALQNFLVNPLHQDLILKYIKPILADMIVVDYVDEAGL